MFWACPTEFGVGAKGGDGLKCVFLLLALRITLFQSQASFVMQACTQIIIFTALYLYELY